jgi:aminoglycoside/choline kinase family phosphotransferase
MIADGLAIADRPEGLTPEWLTAALAAGGHLGEARVVAAETTPVGTGQMCDSVRVALTYDGPTDGPPTLVAKQPAADPTSRATALSMRSYEKEVRFYQELAPTLAVTVPRVLHADIDPATASFVLLMEDLAPATAGDQLAGCDAEAAGLAVAELVNLHAPRWGDTSLTTLDWLDNATPEGREIMATMLPMLWDGFRQRYAGDVLPHVSLAGDALFSGMRAYLRPSGSPPTVVHGDYRLDNLLFSPPPASRLAGVVDWQTCTLGPGVRDVAYFLGAGLDPAERARVEEAMVRDYHAGLEAAGVAGYAWEACWEEYRLGTFAGLLMAVGASMMVERTDRGDQMFLTMADRHARHALDLEAPDLLSAGL